MKRLFLLILPIIYSCNSKTEVDTIIIASKVYSCDTSFTQYEAIAVNNGKILSIGSRHTIESVYKSNNIIDATGAYVYPGLIDAHCHFSGYALNKYQCELIGTKSFEEVLEKLIGYEKQNQLPWLFGRGWDQNDWKIKRFPNKEELDKLFPDKPVILKRIDGHAVLCNQKALDLAGINKQTQIAGGIIEKENGSLTGILIDNATEPVENIIGSLPNATTIEYYQQAEAECFSYGLTGVVDCGVKKYIIKQLQDLYKNEQLNIANSILLSQDSATLNEYVTNGFYRNHQFQINGIKVYADGALGSRGACLLEPYHDKKDHYGLMLSDICKIRLIAALAKEHELQLCTHAIGDSANRAILRLYSYFLEKNNDKRWRIEHAQVIDYQDYKWFSEYKIIPSVQPTHAISDMPWAGDRLGKKRLPTAYAYKKLLDQNGWIALGTDFPVEQIDPLGTFYTAVARQDKEGNPENGFLKENALTRKEALWGMTLWAAKSVFWEKEKGSIEIGKDADLVIFDKDIMTIPSQEILSTKVLRTFVNGKIVYNKKRR